MSLPFHTGQRVELKDLRRDVEMNGLKGTVVKDEGPFVHVHFQGTGVTTVLSQNLKVI